MKPYEAPTLTSLGSLSSLTEQSLPGKTGGEADGASLNGQPLGGSLFFP